jgi:HEAT repeat protein
VGEGPSRIVRALIVAIIVIAARPAAADNVDVLVQQLNNDDSDKVRLSAALSLTKVGDPRAILPMAKALLGDSDKNVRSACAVGLAKLVTASTSPSLKNIAVANLKKAAAEDDSEFVKAQATRSLAQLGGGGSTVTPPHPGGGSIYVNIGPMSSKTNASDDSKLRDLMKRTASRTMGKVASEMAITWPGGDPKRGDLDRKGVAGFYVDGTLNELSAKVAGSASTVSCKISMLLASYPEKSVFGFLSGGASVQASAKESDIALARQDCVSAVVEDLIAKKIVPTIKTKASSN